MFKAEELTAVGFDVNCIEDVVDVVFEKDVEGSPGGVAEEGLEGSLREDDVSGGRSKRKSIVQSIVDDFNPNKGDHKILRAICRTATVNTAVLVATATGGVSMAPAAGFVAGGAIAARRCSDGIVHKDEKEVTKSLAVYGSATCASISGQVIAGAVMITFFHAALPVVAAVAFGMGCCSGIVVGALSEWTVDSVFDGMKESAEKCVSVGASPSGTWVELRSTWTSLIELFRSGRKSVDAASFDQAHMLARKSSGNSEHSEAKNPQEGMDRSSLQEDLESLKAERMSLHQMLHSDENDFFERHKRQVSSCTDIRPVASMYCRVDEIDKAIEQKSSSGGTWAKLRSTWASLITNSKSR